MGLGPKYEGAFIPPAKPRWTPEQSEEEYRKEVDRYIEQLHDQLSASFTNTQQVINQIIYQGDGDGGATSGPNTEEGGTDIVSTSPALVEGNFSPSSSGAPYWAFPSGGTAFARAIATGYNNLPNNVMPVFRAHVPYSLSVAKARYYWRSPAVGGQDTVVSYGFYDESKTLLWQNTVTHLGALASGYMEDTFATAQALNAGLHWFAWTMFKTAGGNGEIQGWVFQPPESDVLKETFSFGEDSVGAALGVLPGAITAINITARQYPPFITFMGA